MDDLISRQAAIDAVYDAFCYAYCDNCEKEMNEDLCGDCHRKYQNWSASKKIIEKVINNLPSAQPERRWIPCSEKLPKKSGLYYVSGGDKVWVCKFLIIPNFTGGWCNDASNPVVQAWIPLPEPWKGEEE